jgi:hypothetical protein
LCSLRLVLCVLSSKNSQPPSVSRWLMDKKFLRFLGKAFLLLHPAPPSAGVSASHKKPEIKRRKKQGKRG